MNEFNIASFNENDYIKILDMLYEYTHKKDFLVICNSEDIKNQLEKIEISDKYKVIIDTMICESANSIYVLPMNQLEKPIKFIVERDDMNYDLLYGTEL